MEREKTTPAVEVEDSSPKVHIIGGTGFVGAVFEGEQYERSGRENVDITDPASVKRYFERENPSTVVLAAAYTDVNGAEKELEKVQRINVEGARNVALVCAEYGSHLIYISSDFVFPGTEEFPGPYSEDTPPPASSEARGIYGNSKYLGEQEVLNSGAQAAIVRIAYPFVTGGERDFVVRTLQMMKSGWQLFDDQVITPTNLNVLKEAVGRMSSRRLTGVFHIASVPLTPYQLGRYLKRALNLPLEVKRGSMRKFLEERKGATAPRPVLGGLRTLSSQKRLEMDFGYWHNQVDEMIEQGLLSSE